MIIRSIAILATLLTHMISFAEGQTLPTASANASYIAQIGDLNSAIVSQTGGGNTQTTLQGAVSPSALTQLPNFRLLTIGPSFNDTAITTQLANLANGGSNSSLTVQLGVGSNASNIMQVALAGGTNNQTTFQSGFENAADTAQIAHAGLTNTSAIVQIGNHNTATVMEK
jgi:hypothetical protein